MKEKLRKYLHLYVDNMIDTMPAGNHLPAVKTNADAIHLLVNFSSEFLNDASVVMTLEAATAELENA